ncbi:MAG: ComEC/Rec2 family competence protein, partial [Clostridia bacterium]|nr:ComEC/Rec2 family competence protein [Clostridia bacterium]
MGLFHFDRRPLLLLGAGACCGVYIATGRSCLYAILLVVALTALGLACRTSLRLIVAFFVTVAFFGLWGFVSSSALDSSYMEFDGRDCFITGRVVSVDAQKDRYTLITVKPEGIFSKKLKVYLFDNRIDFIQGDGISLTGELMKPESATNPGGYDSRKMLYGDGVTAIVFCGEGKVAFQEGVSAGHLFGLLRRDIQVRCRDFLGSENGNLVSAMLIGDKAELDPKVKDEFRDSGLSHTMAVSGSHVAYIILPLYFIFTKLGVEKKKYYPWIIVLLIFFALLAGMQPSVLRAGITAVIMLVGGLIDRNPEPLNSLAASAIILLIINPFSLYDAGFILSFTSVLSILLFYKPITYFLGNNPVSGVVSMSIAVQLGILPVMAKLFYNVQIFSVFANILVFPVRALLSVMAWLMYLLSCVYIPIGNVLSYPVGILADMMASTAELFSSSTWSVVNLVNIHPLIIAVYYVVLW